MRARVRLYTYGVRVPEGHRAEEAMGHTSRVCCRLRGGPARDITSIVGIIGIKDISDVRSIRDIRELD